MSNETYQRFVDRYESKELPWADELPPPEVIDFVSTAPPGRALDLGCGYGRTAIYLAQHGWQADGVDFVPAAIDEAIVRSIAAEVVEKTRFFVGSASNPHMVEGPYDLAVDIGCMHSFTDEMLSKYSESLKKLLRSGATYLLYVHFRDEEAEDRPHGILKETIAELFSSDFTLDKVEFGTTQVEDRPVYNSAWYWFLRN
ncbi:MAG: class I SAM-dependent methyltransferase [Chloroflexota bacterium]